MALSMIPIRDDSGAIVEFRVEGLPSSEEAVIRRFRSNSGKSQTWGYRWCLESILKQPVYKKRGFVTPREALDGLVHEIALLNGFDEWLFREELYKASTAEFQEWLARADAGDLPCE